MHGRAVTLIGEIKIRTAKKADAQALLEIYAPYVKNTAITFEYDVPTLEEFEKRIETTLVRYPYLVAENDGKIVGYAYAGSFKEREAYDWAVETSIYVRSDAKDCGIGKKLYFALEEILKKQNILNVNACIAYPEKEDEYLTKNSEKFHKHLGYRLVGEFYKCGFKFGRWYNMIWMEKHLGEHTSNVKPVIWFSDYEKEGF